MTKITYCFKVQMLEREVLLQKQFPHLATHLGVDQVYDAVFLTILPQNTHTL